MSKKSYAWMIGLLAMVLLSVSVMGIPTLTMNATDIVKVSGTLTISVPELILYNITNISKVGNTCYVFNGDDYALDLAVNNSECSHYMVYEGTYNVSNVNLKNNYSIFECESQNTVIRQRDNVVNDVTKEAPPVIDFAPGVHDVTIRNCFVDGNAENNNNLVKNHSGTGQCSGIDTGYRASDVSTYNIFLDHLYINNTIRSGIVARNRVTITDSVLGNSINDHQVYFSNSKGSSVSNSRFHGYYFQEMVKVSTSPGTAQAESVRITDNYFSELATNPEGKSQDFIIYVEHGSNGVLIDGNIINNSDFDTSSGIIADDGNRTTITNNILLGGTDGNADTDGSIRLRFGSDKIVADNQITGVDGTTNAGLIGMGNVIHQSDWIIRDNIINASCNRALRFYGTSGKNVTRARIIGNTLKSASYPMRIYGGMTLEESEIRDNIFIAANGNNELLLSSGSAFNGIHVKTDLANKEYEYNNVTLSNITLSNVQKIGNDYYLYSGNGEDIERIVEEMNGIGTLYLGRGVFTDFSLNISNSEVRIVGAGTSETFLSCEHDYSCITVDDSSATRVYYIEISDLKINGTNSSNSVGLNISNMTYSRFDNVEIKNFSTGVLCDLGNCWYNDFFHMKIFNAENNIYLSNAANQNNFYGGYSTQSYGNQLYIEDSNNINFYGYSFEGDTETINITGTSRQIGFFGCRFEMYPFGDTTIYVDQAVRGVRLYGGLCAYNYLDNRGQNTVDECEVTSTNRNSGSHFYGSYTVHGNFTVDGNITNITGGIMNTCYAEPGDVDDLITRFANYDSAQCNKLVVADGNYVIPYTLNTTTDDMTIECTGWGANLTLASGVDNSIFHVNHSGFKLKNCYLFEGSKVNNLYLKGLVEMGAGARDALIEGNYFRMDQEETEGHAVLLDSSSLNSIVRNNVMDGGRNGVWAYNDNLIEGNTMHNQSHLGIMLRLGNRNRVIGNTVLNSSGGIGAEAVNPGDCYGNIIYGNVIKNATGGSGISIDNCDAMTVSGNFIYDVAFYGILLNTTKRSSFSNNIIDSPDKIGVYFRSDATGHSEYNVWSHNVFLNSTGAANWAWYNEDPANNVYNDMYGNMAQGYIASRLMNDTASATRYGNFDTSTTNNSILRATKFSRPVNFVRPIEINATQGYTGSCADGTALTVVGGIITDCS